MDLPRELTRDMRGHDGAPLLKLARNVGRHLAGVALETWFQRAMLHDRHDGRLIITSMDLFHRNSPEKANVPMVLGARDPETGPNLALFRDGSAVILERDALHLRAVPFVFTLARSTAMPISREPVTLRMARQTGNTLLKVMPDNAPGSWVSLQAGLFNDLSNITFEDREELTAQLLWEAAAWARETRSQDVLVDVADGLPARGTAPVATHALGNPTDAIAGQPYRHPAFLAYRGFSQSDEEAFGTFLREICDAILLHDPSLDTVDIKVVAAPLVQSSRMTTRPTIKTSAHAGTVRKILESSLSPIDWKAIVGQSSEQFRNRQPVMTPVTLPHRFSDRARIEALSAHERMDLMSRFGAFLDR